MTSILCSSTEDLTRESSEDGRSPTSLLLGSTTSGTLKVFKRRWWILVVFCSVNFTQGLLWNNWAPVGDAMLIAYNWHASFLALALLLAGGGVVITAFPFVSLIKTKGLRLGLVVSVSLLLLGTAMWNIGLPTGQNWLMLIGSLVVGLVAAAITSAIPLVSALWFPESERTTATAASNSLSAIGTGFAFITGPYISGANVTASQVKHRNKLPAEYISELRTGIEHLVYFDSALAVACFIMVMVYFPDRPPKPPSRSQTSSRADFLPSLKRVIKSPQYWLLGVSYILGTSFTVCWFPLLSVNFTKSLDVDQTTTGWIGFTSTMVGCISSICIALVMDKFKRKYKLVIIILTVFASLLFLIMGCIQQHYLPLPHQYTTGVLYALCIAIAICTFSMSPLYYELACEITFPAYEAVPTMLLNIFDNGTEFLVYGFCQIPLLSQDLRWMTWVCLSTCLLSLPLLVAMKEKFHRLDMEKENTG